MLGFYGFCMLYSILKILIENPFGIEKKQSEGLGVLPFNMFISYFWLFWHVMATCQLQLMLWKMKELAENLVHTGPAYLEFSFNSSVPSSLKIAIFVWGTYEGLGYITRSLFNFLNLGFLYHMLPFCFL
jgi:hypothetical protein